jgi:hypothetical protein
MKTAVSTLFSIPLLLAQLSAAASIDCEHIRIGGKKFDVSNLAGRHNVTVHDTSRPPAEYNTTWSLDLCAPLKKIDGVPDANQCPFGTRGRVIIYSGFSGLTGRQCAEW